MRKHRFFDFELLLKFNFYVKLFKSKIRNTQHENHRIGNFYSINKKNSLYTHFDAHDRKFHSEIQDWIIIIRNI